MPDVTLLSDVVKAERKQREYWNRQAALMKFQKDTYDISGKIFGAWKGRKYGAWGGDLTPSKATTVLIEQPEHIIESIFQDELGVTSVDVASIDAIATDRASWVFARSITVAQNSLDYIRTICEEAALISTRSSSGTERLTAISNAASTSITLTTSDIALEGVRPLCKKYETPLEAVKNEFYLNYNYNYAKGQYDSQVYCTASADNLTDNTRTNTDSHGATYQALCTNSQARYVKVERWEFNADWIRTKAVADAFIKIIMNWLSYRRWIFEATLLYTANSLKLELGDKILINHSLLPAGVSNTRQFIVTRLVDGGMSRIGKIDAQFMMIPEII